MVDKSEVFEKKNPWRFTLWLGAGADFVGHEMGEEALEKYMIAGGEAFARDFLARGAAELMRSLAGSNPQELTEDDEKMVVKRRECLTGGRMEREGITRKLAGGKYKGMTPYCVHCPTWWHKLAKEWFGYDIDFKYGEGGRGCTWTYYKKPRKAH